MFNTLKVAQAEKQIYPESMGQTNGSREETDRDLQPTATSCTGAASCFLRFVGLAAAFGEAAWRAAVRRSFVRAAWNPLA
jgi:hypothetical protein